MTLDLRNGLLVVLADQRVDGTVGRMVAPAGECTSRGVLRLDVGCGGSEFRRSESGGRSAAGGRVPRRSCELERTRVDRQTGAVVPGKPAHHSHVDTDLLLRLRAISEERGGDLNSALLRLLRRGVG